MNKVTQGVDFERVKRFLRNIIVQEDVDYSQFESRRDNTDIVTFRENDGEFRLFKTNVHVKVGAYIACLIGFCVTVAFCITYTFYHDRGLGRNPFIDQLELVDLVFCVFVGIPCHFALFYGIRNEKKQWFAPFLIFYLTNFILNIVMTVVTVVAAAMDVHRQIFGNIKYDLSWTAFQVIFTSAQGLAIYVVMRCRKYAAAKDYWKRRTAERSNSVIADGVSIED